MVKLFFDNLELPEDTLLGLEGKGLKVIFDGLNAKRTLIAAKCIGDGYWFLERPVTTPANVRFLAAPSVRTSGSSSCRLNALSSTEPPT